MQTMTLKSHVGSDGILRLEVPVNRHDVELDVVIVLNDSVPTTEWGEAFFTTVVGSIDDPTFIRHAQGVADSRESFQ